MTDDQREALMAIQAAVAAVQLQIDYFQSLVTADTDAGDDEEVVHGWTDSAFDSWWESLTDKQKNFHHMQPVRFPAGLTLSRADFDYWNTRAIRRSRNYNYRNTRVPTGMGMIQTRVTGE